MRWLCRRPGKLRISISARCGNPSPVARSEDGSDGDAERIDRGVGSLRFRAEPEALHEPSEDDFGLLEFLTPDQSEHQPYVIEDQPQELQLWMVNPGRVEAVAHKMTVIREAYLVVLSQAGGRAAD